MLRTWHPHLSALPHLYSSRWAFPPISFVYLSKLFLSVKKPFWKQKMCTFFWFSLCFWLQLGIRSLLSENNETSERDWESSLVFVWMNWNLRVSSGIKLFHNEDTILSSSHTARGKIESMSCGLVRSGIPFVTQPLLSTLLCCEMERHQPRNSQQLSSHQNRNQQLLVQTDVGKSDEMAVWDSSGTLVLQWFFFEERGLSISHSVIMWSPVWRVLSQISLSTQAFAKISCTDFSNIPTKRSDTVVSDCDWHPSVKIEMSEQRVKVFLLVSFLFRLFAFFRLVQSQEFYWLPEWGSWLWQTLKWLTGEGCLSNSPVSKHCILGTSWRAGTQLLEPVVTWRKWRRSWNHHPKRGDLFFKKDSLMDNHPLEGNMLIVQFRLARTSRRTGRISFCQEIWFLVRKLVNAKKSPDCMGKSIRKSWCGCSVTWRLFGVAHCVMASYLLGNICLVLQTWHRKHWHGGKGSKTCNCHGAWKAGVGPSCQHSTLDGGVRFDADRKENA